MHHQDVVADLLDDREVVGDEEQRDPEVAPDLLEQLEHLRLDRDVERGDRLVEDQHGGIGGERTGDGDALSLSPDSE